MLKHALIRKGNWVGIFLVSVDGKGNVTLVSTEPVIAGMSLDDLKQKIDLYLAVLQNEVILDAADDGLVDRFGEGIRTTNRRDG